MTDTERATAAPAGKTRPARPAGPGGAPGPPTPRAGARVRRLRVALLWSCGIALLPLSVAVAVTIGPARISVPDVWSAVAAHLGAGESTLTPIRDGIIWNLRMPRTLLAAVCGAGLAVCGTVMQSLLRNPLADPFVLGVSSGASTGAVVVVVLGTGGGAVSLSTGALIGALCSFALVLLLSHTLGGTVDRVVLSGVAAMQLFSALTSFVVMTAADAEQTRGVLFWLLGSLAGVGWSDVGLCAAVLAATLLICLGHARTLDAFAFGQDAAAALGVHVARTRLVLLCTTALLTAALVSSAGAIGFVGLVLPHAARALAGSGTGGCSRSPPWPGRCSWSGSTPSPGPSWTPRRCRSASSPP